MKKIESTWRFVMKIVGASLAVAGIVCLVIAYWDKLTACCSTIGEKCKSKCKCMPSEYDDYEDELLYE